MNQERNVKKQYVHYDGIVFLIVLLIVFLSKLSVLTTPYYWDEIGWINSPHWLSRQNLLRALPGLHPLGTFFGHPPGLHVSMALLFKIFGESIWLSHFFIVCFSFAGVYFTYLLGKDRFGRFVGIFSALFLFFTPMYFAQSGMYLGDVPVAAMGVMSIYFGLKKRYLPYLIASIYLVFIKETGAAIILAYLLYFVCKEFTKERQFYLQVLKYSIPLWLITVFMIWQKITAGKFLGIYSFEFDIYKHTTEAVFQDFITILKWIFVYQHRYIFTILILLFIILFPKRALRKELLLFLLIFVLAVLPFSYFMLLPRYLLPFLPYLCIAGAWALCELISSVKIRTALGLAITALFISSLSGSISYGNNEWNMKYVKIVNMYKSMCQYVEREFPNSSILTMFPFNGAMRKPYLGYVTRPLNAVALTKNIRENKCDLILFSAPSDPKRISLLMDFAKKDKMVLVKRIEEEGIVSELYRKPQSNEQGTISMRNN